MTSDILKAAALQASAILVQTTFQQLPDGAVGNLGHKAVLDAIKGDLSDWYQLCLSIVDAEATQKSEVKMDKLFERLHNCLYKIANGYEVTNHDDASTLVALGYASDTDADYALTDLGHEYANRFEFRDIPF